MVITQPVSTFLNTVETVPRNVIRTSVVPVQSHANLQTSEIVRVQNHAPRASHSRTHYLEPQLRRSRHSRTYSRSVSPVKHRSVVNHVVAEPVLYTEPAFNPSHSYITRTVPEPVVVEKTVIDVQQPEIMLNRSTGPDYSAHID